MLKKTKVSLTMNKMSYRTLKSIIFLAIIIMQVAVFGQPEDTENDYEQKGIVANSRHYDILLEKEKRTLIDSNDELLNIDGVIWQRKYGEKKYFLSPRIRDISNYNERIRRLDNKKTGIKKSEFVFAKITLNKYNWFFLSYRFCDNIQFRCSKNQYRRTPVRA